MQTLRRTSSYDRGYSGQQKPNASFLSNEASQGGIISDRFYSSPRSVGRTFFQPQRDLNRLPNSVSKPKMDNAIRQSYDLFPPGRQLNLERSRASQRASTGVVDSRLSANDMLPSMARRRSRLSYDRGLAIRAAADRQRGPQQLADRARLRRIQPSRLSRLRQINRLLQQNRNPGRRLWTNTQPAMDISAQQNQRQISGGGTRTDRFSFGGGQQTYGERVFHAGNVAAGSGGSFLDARRDPSFVEIPSGNSTSVWHGHDDSQPSSSFSKKEEDHDYPGMSTDS